ncbi:MAG: hypothetical protein RBR93_05645 [Aliarcobacter butzleri]|uniref:hypothetical protein n=1 Tax=Aliarcobacter butzleri TaxID=28197 RepID=UPI001EDB65C4|nr:hypothetical protein [Aliarcobacter butzleri]MCG3651392.1 hypothetical protein [Aliarcobacter butzleri]MDY0192998.1 hypothetical protein [Aliarcobacter butzleri]
MYFIFLLGLIKIQRKISNFFSNYISKNSENENILDEIKTIKEVHVHKNDTLLNQNYLREFLSDEAIKNIFVKFRDKVISKFLIFLRWVISSIKYKVL